MRQRHMRILLGQAALVSANLLGLGEPAVHAAEPEPAEASTLAASFDPERPVSVPEDSVLEASGAVVGEIVVRVGNVFDLEAPGENHRLYRLVNRLHRKTRTGVVRDLLLFKSGARYSRRLLDESERLLRDTGFLYDAQIRPMRYEDGRVDLLVKTRDVWSLEFGVGLGRSGGENVTRIGLKDQNFLGLGKSLNAKRTNDVDRTSLLLQYRDRNMFGKRLKLDLGYSDNSDGREKAIGLARPFFSLDSRWAAGAKWSSFDRVDSTYLLGKVTSQFQHIEKNLEVYGGISRGAIQGRTRRWIFGVTSTSDGFGAAANLPVPTSIPANRKLVYPWVGLESIRDGFFVAKDLDQVQRTEDRNLSRQFELRLGWASPSFGSDRSQAIVSASLENGLRPGEGQLLFFSAHGSGRLGSGGENNNAVVGSAVRYYVRDWGENIMYALLDVDLAENPDAEDQLLIGGDSGLRGYPLRYQAGDRRILLTVEQRWYSNWHPLKLFHVGAAAFLDIGRAWFTGYSPDERLDWLRDVGVGLRLGSSRTASGSLVHVDLAWPLDGDSSISSVQVLVTTKSTF